MKLCLYSGGDRKLNGAIDQKLISWLPGKKTSFAFIPSAGDKDRQYFMEFKKYYSFYGLKNFTFFSLEDGYGDRKCEEILQSDAIYLSGGNTYHFLYWLKKRKLMDRLRSFAQNKGALVGASAGSILMTPNINLAGLPFFDCDENKIGIKNLDALQLTDFEFLPHYSFSPRADKEIIRYSKTSSYPIFAVPDGSGAMVDDMEGEAVEIIGKSRVFYKGNILS